MKEGTDAIKLLTLFVMIFVILRGYDVGVSVDKDAGIIVIFYLHPVDLSPLRLVKPNEERSLIFFTDIITSLDLKYELQLFTYT